MEIVKDTSTSLPTTLGIAPFEAWTYEDVEKLVKDKKKINYDVQKAYAIDKDFFRKGVEWVGPGEGAGNPKIAQQFAPEDATGEVLSNVSNAFSEPQVGGIPLDTPIEGKSIPEELKTKIHEAVTMISGWWDDRHLQEHIQERQKTGATFGVAGLRLWIPWRFLNISGGVITIKPTTDIAEALSYIHISAPLPDVGTMIVDSGTQDKCAVFLDEEVIMDGTGQKQSKKRAELVYLEPDRVNDRDAKTIVRTVYQGGQQGTKAELQLGGRLLFSEMIVQSLLSDPVIRTQRQLNLLCTLITRIAEAAAFPERYTMNAKPQGTRKPYNDGDSVPNGGFLEKDDAGLMWVVVPEERTLGAATTTELVGLPAVNDQGDFKMNQMPGVERFDPVDPKPYIEAADSSRRRILRMCSQGHLGGISQAESSGIAYEQARAVFEKDLNKRRTAEEGTMRDILMAALSLAEFIAGKIGFYTDVLRLTVDQRIDAGPRSPDLVRLDLESYTSGVLSLETTMARVGVEDIEAELVRVRRSSAYILDVLDKIAQTTTAFDPASLIAALTELGLPTKVVAALKPFVPPAPVVKPPTNTGA